MKVLFTGSCGFLLSNSVIYSLQETDWDIISIDKLTKAGSIKNVPQVKRHKLYVGDICDQHFIDKVFEVEQPDVIMHGAEENLTTSDAIDSPDLVKTNVAGTYNLLNSALKIPNLKKFINISTDKVYGNVISGLANEERKLVPANPYAASKASADLLGQSYFNVHRLPVVTVRCANVFGPRQRLEKFIPRVISNSLSGKKIPIFDGGKSRRDWIYVKDCFGAIRTIIDNGLAGEVYNISAGCEQDNLTIAKLILNTLCVSEGQLEFPQNIKSSLSRCVADSSKLYALGWKPQYKLDEALAHTVGWYKANSWVFK